MCHSQIEGDKDEQDRDEQEMKEREIFGSSSLSKLRQKNRLIFVFMLKALKYFGLSVSRIVLWDFLEKPWTSSAASSYAILSLLIVLISTATFIISTFEVRDTKKEYKNINNLWKNKKKVYKDTKIVRHCVPSHRSHIHGHLHHLDLWGQRCKNIKAIKKL